MRLRLLGGRSLLLSGRPTGLSGPAVLRRTGAALRRRRRFCPGLCDRPRGGSSRADPAGHLPSGGGGAPAGRDRKSTRLNSSHVRISYAVFCLKKKKKKDG